MGARRAPYLTKGVMMFIINGRCVGTKELMATKAGRKWYLEHKEEHSVAAKTCRRCGAVFETHRQGKQYCSADCRVEQSRVSMMFRNRAIIKKAKDKLSAKIDMRRSQLVLKGCKI